MQLADFALGELYEAILPVPLEDQGAIDCFRIIGFRASCTHFLRLFASATGFDSPFIEVVRGHIMECEATGSNPAGLERAELALRFAASGIEEALDALDKMDGAEDWHDPLTMAKAVVDLMDDALDTAIGRPGLAPGMWRPSNN